MNSEQVREGLQQVRAELERLQEIEAVALEVRDMLSPAGHNEDDPMLTIIQAYDALYRVLERGRPHA